ncbi:putative P-loop containing nucleoside triphosphate hydrolase, leucine-rich repeat domain, L [Medicago truncatula]|uniref:LRR and NB-ARC domain disease resistance protein n=1 Tax=Medicago truncatula TaxID=3880 RepID=G7IZK0_MEDTR|nr:putative disease resistance RPP13-like protein 1 [Medicago truncatula]AES69765.1 LRR and NB-ARC domain disease resistance protein [Medicago truncatula]RHN66388.1 putative P-loop containing nucleoside triphosphate hydrolase, leucine-rich repeat domain, L [Medicago truncatula]
MAATLVGGAFLSASVQTMLDKLTSTEFRDFINNKKLNVSLLKQLQTTLLVLQAVLDDAEEKQINNRAVKKWVDDLKDAIFDAEDLLNQISYESLRCKVENTQAANKTNQVWNFLSSPFKNIYGEINSQIKTMCDNLQIFAQNKDILGLQTKSARIFHRTPSSSVVNESFMVGRKDDKETITNMLLSKSSTSNNNIGVVAILGMGGVGKTTLAQIAYNDEKVQEHFDLKAWACVSEDFDILRVTKTLLESVTSRAWENNNLDFLRVELKKTLRDKRFLFVLDDLWNDNYNDWDELVTPLINGNNGSRVIVTTRQQKVAEVAHTFPIHKLEVLSNEDTWSLLSKHAFGSENFCDNKCSNLEAIGRKIARKCAGLPIAAKTLGGVLRSKRDAKEWTEVLDNKIWNLPNDNVLPALLLSYQYLPSQLKRCFSYCSIFPKDYTLYRKQLVLLWMAEGFLDHSKDEKPMEEVGDDCFAELLSRSLIQQLHVDTRGERFVMHDFVNDLATLVSGKSCYRVEFGGDASKNVRHCSYNQEKYDTVKKFKIFYKFKCLRTFLPCVRWDLNYLTKRVVDDLLPTFRMLRVLSLSRYTNIAVLPDSIGSLVQLRYLDLSCTKIKSLPEIICNLYYLQTLILSFCSNLSELPEHVGKLINLRHLDIDFTGITEMPKQIVELENLQTLTIFLVGKQNVGLSVRELARFPKLQGKLFIKNLQNVIDVVEAYDADLKSKEHIEELTLQWGVETDDSLKEKDVLDMLIPPVNLNRLNIYFYGGTSFPSWLGDSSFSNMVSLCIENCRYCVTLPPLGQLSSLKDLTIRGMSILETIGPEFYGIVGGGSNSSFQPFSSLEKLEFTNMPNWKKWLLFQDGILPFPCLKSLKLYDCTELRGNLPSHLSSIEEFVNKGCPHLLESPPTLEWLSSIKEIDFSGSLDSTETRWPFVESDSPCLLQCVALRFFDTIFSLPKMILSSTCLKFLKLHSVPSLTVFPRDGLPTSLQELCIYNCEKLSFMPPETWSNYTSLLELTLTNSCNSLSSFPLNGFPKLQELFINRCTCLESIFISESSSHHPSNLQKLILNSCKALISLPQRMNTLTTLEILYLHHLPKLELSLCEGVFLPPKLQTISITSVRITKMPPLIEWGFQSLTSLSYLYIKENDDIVNTLLKEQLLPVSLMFLSISNLSEVKCLGGNGLRHLSSLETLSFYDCQRIESFPEHSLPSSLKLLHISNCPVLEERYESEGGRNWSEISYIPVIEINGKVTI